ncbi:hypothetical protein LINPERPRIM_LOCUS11389 [Linum perenne]
MRTLLLFILLILVLDRENVVQVVTDNAANYVAAGKLINARYKHIYRTSCVAHTVNLVFKDICALPHIDRLAKSALKITTFMYNHGALLHWLRERPSWKEIVRPGATRFSTTFLTLDSIVHQQVDLECLMVDESFRESALDKSTLGEDVRTIIFDRAFWEECKWVVELMEPLICGCMKQLRILILIRLRKLSKEEMIIPASTLDLE